MKHIQLRSRLLAMGLAGVALLAIGPLSGVAALSPARGGQQVGIDVSHWQGRISWKVAKRDGVRFVFAKATEGQDFVDRQYVRNRERTTALGIAFSAYHFARPDRSAGDAVREADHFVRTARLRGHHLPPVLDLEVTGGLRPARLIRWVRAWVQRVEARLGVKPIIYTGFHFWRDSMANTRWFAKSGYRLWIAHWYVDAPRVPAGGWAGRGWTFWQRTDCGSVAGIRGCVDLDHYAGADPTLLTIKRLRGR